MDLAKAALLVPDEISRQQGAFGSEHAHRLGTLT
jgi:hypothetical protein